MFIELKAGGQATLVSQIFPPTSLLLHSTGNPFSPLPIHRGVFPSPYEEP